MNEFYERRTQFQRVHLACLPKKMRREEMLQKPLLCCSWQWVALLLALSLWLWLVSGANALWPKRRWQEPRISYLWLSTCTHIHLRFSPWIVYCFLHNTLRWRFPRCHTFSGILLFSRWWRRLQSPACCRLQLPKCVCVCSVCVCCVVT